MSELKGHVHKLVDDWLGLGGLEDQNPDDIAGFERWLVKKVEAGNELSSFAEEVLDEMLGEFTGTQRDFGPALDRTIAAAEQRGAVRTLRDAATAIEKNNIVFDGDHYQPCNSCMSIHMNWLDYRADQMEGDE